MRVRRTQVEETDQKLANVLEKLSTLEKLLRENFWGSVNHLKEFFKM